MFSQQVIDDIKEGKPLDFLFKSAHRLRNEKDFKTFISDARVQILWRKFIKTNKNEIFNNMEVNAIRGKNNLIQTENLLNEVAQFTGINFQLVF